MSTKRSLRMALVAVVVAVPGLVFAVLGPTPSSAATAAVYVTTNVNQRAGPGVDYPVVATVPARAAVTIYACLSDYGWCDVSYQRNRGWMLARYLQGYDQGRYVPIRAYALQVRVPIVTFDINVYWNSYYRSRPFYAQLSRWSAPRQPTLSIGVFYGPLSPHGDWVWLRGQYVWVPTRVDASWRPYTMGHWAYTKQYGWLWVSAESFGWATYHYGRWGFSKQIGWFWVPGTRWAPAWVTWRGSDDYLAWAPLPPARDDSLSIEITIGVVPDYYWQVVPVSAFLSVDLSSQIIRDKGRFKPVFEATRPVGNVTIVNNIVVNNVVDIQFIEKKTQEKVIAHEVVAASSPDQLGKVVEGGKVEVFTPPPPTEAAAVEAPAEVKKVEEVAAESQTKEQAGNQPATEELVVPPAEPPPPPTGEEATPPPAKETPPAEEAVPPTVEQPQAEPASEAPVEPSAPAEQATPPAAEQAPAEPVPAKPTPTPEQKPPPCPEGTTLLEDGSCSTPADQAAPPAAEQAPAEAVPAEPTPTPKQKQPPCPEGTTLLEDGSCSAPAQ